jgi:hypothetical protein
MTLPWHQKVIFENQDDKAFFDTAGLTHPNQSVSIKGCGVDMNFFQTCRRLAKRARHYLQFYRSIDL